MNFYRPRRCNRMGIVQRDGKWYCQQHDPETQADRERDRDAKRKERIRQAIVAKYGANRSRQDEAKMDQVYWRDLGEQDKVIETEFGFSIVTADDKIPIYWNSGEADKAIAAMKKRANFKMKSADSPTHQEFRW